MSNPAGHGNVVQILDIVKNIENQLDNLNSEIVQMKLKMSSVRCNCSCNNTKSQLDFSNLEYSPATSRTGKLDLKGKLPLLKDKDKL